MNNVAQTNDRRSKKSHAKANDDEDARGTKSATLFEAVRAEMQRARELMLTDPRKAADTLDVVDGLLVGVDEKLRNILGLVEGAEECLGPAALAFARVDVIATREMLGAALHDERETFSLGIGDVFEHVRAVAREVSDIAAFDEDGNGAFVGMTNGADDDANEEIAPAAEE